MVAYLPTYSRGFMVFNVNTLNVVCFLLLTTGGSDLPGCLHLLTVEAL